MFHRSRPRVLVFPVTRQKMVQLFRKVKHLSMSVLWVHDDGLRKTTAIHAVWGLALGDGRRTSTSAVDVLLYYAYFWFVLSASSEN